MQRRELSKLAETVHGLKFPIRYKIVETVPKRGLWLACLGRYRPTMSDVAYMTVREAIVEQERARTLNRLHRPNTVRLPPSWSELHATNAARFSTHSSPHKVRGFPRAEDGLTAITASGTSSVHGLVHEPSSPVGHSSAGHSALGGSMKSGLNHTSTYYYGEAPLKPTMSAENPYNMVGTYSMFGSQAVSDRLSSQAFGFGSSTRDQMLRTYISPAHLKDLYGKYSPAPDKYTLQSSLGRQVLHSKMSYPARSFGNEDRFDANRRDARAAQTPGPGAYRV